MRRLLTTIGLMVAVGACSDRSARAPAATGAPCDRACLEGFIDRYLTALAARDPSSLPLTDDVTFVENNQILRVGDGTWRTVTGLGTYRHYFADPEAGQVAVIAGIEERGSKAIYDLRLAIEDHRIAEIEALVVRDPNGARLYEELGAPLPIFVESVPPDRRVPRSELVRVSDLYFSGMERNRPDGDYSFFADNCDRLEHARRTTNMPAQTYGHSDDTVFVTLSCRQQFETGFLGFVTRIRDRRYAVIDEERQSVFAFAFLDHDGTVRAIPLSNGSVFTVPPYFSVPRTLQVGEAWRIENGKLRQIEMTLSEFPYGTRPRFDTGDTWLESGAAAAHSASAIDDPCDRRCLKGAMDRFLRALEAKDPALLELSADVRYTENGQRLNPGDGLWGTVTAVDRGGAYALDPATGQAGYYGAITEHDTKGILVARLRVVDRRVAEIEAVAVRRETAGERGGTLTLFAPRLPSAPDPDGLAARVRALVEPLRPSDRVPAAEMIVAAHGAPGGAARLRDARPLVVDEEAGLVLDLGFFDVAGTTDSADIPGIGPVSLPEASTGPFTVMIASLHTVRQGNAAGVESVARSVPYGMTSAWPPAPATR